MKKVGYTFILVMSLVLLTACNTTPSSQKVATIPVAASRFEGKTCTELETRWQKLGRYEKRLAKQQDKRYLMSMGMVTVLGVGLGEGDTEETLGLVRGEMRTIKKVMSKQGCAMPQEINIEGADEIGSSIESSESP